MYPSKYTDKLVTEANHIVEILMERKALKEGKKLTKNFWNLPEWKKHYNLSLIQVSAALNAYSFKAILNALQANKWAWSITAKQVKQSILEEEAKIKRYEVKKEVLSDEKSPDIISELPTSRPSFGKPKINLD